MSDFSETGPYQTVPPLETNSGNGEPSASTLSAQLDALQSKIDALDKKREDTGAQRVNTEVLEKKISDNYIDLGVEFGKKVRNGVFLIFGVIAGISGLTAGAWNALREANPVEAQDVKKTVEERSDDLSDKVKDNTKNGKAANRKIRNIGREVIRLRDSQNQWGDYISNKIDAISPRAKSVPEPPTVLKHRLDEEHDALDKRVDALIGPEDDG